LYKEQKANNNLLTNKWSHLGFLIELINVFMGWKASFDENEYENESRSVDKCSQSAYLPAGPVHQFKDNLWLFLEEKSTAMK